MDWNQVIEQCAKAAHEVNMAYCVSIGDHSQVHWENAPEWQKSSAMDGVKNIIGDGTPGTDPGNVTPEMSHKGWMDQKIAGGWIYGEVKDPKAKTHPCMVPYDQLPKSQRAKDYIFIAVVRQTKEAINLSFSSAPQ